MILVIDATKGIKTQTAECLLIGEILQRQLIVILNKVDSFEEETRSQKIIQVSENIKKVISATSFKNNFDVVPMISVPKDEKQLALQKSYIDQLLYLILSKIKIPIRKIEGPFIFFIDHSFQIKGQGTVTTGTVLSGKANVGDVIEFPQLGDSKKIKSMQTFKKPVKFALQGDRVGICLPQFDISNVLLISLRGE